MACPTSWAATPTAKTGTLVETPEKDGPLRWIIGDRKVRQAREDFDVPQAVAVEISRSLCAGDSESVPIWE